MDELDFVFKKIIEIDNKATEVKENTNLVIAEKELLLNQEIQTLDDKLIGNSKAELDNRLSIAIDECEKKAELIVEEANNYCKNIQQKYKEIKDELKEIFVNEILEAQ